MFPYYLKYKKKGNHIKYENVILNFRFISHIYLLFLEFDDIIFNTKFNCKTINLFTSFIKM